MILHYDRVGQGAARRKAAGPSNGGQDTPAARPLERPILFRADLVRAILAGDKTVTRRVVRRPLAISHRSAADGGYWHLMGNDKEQGGSLTDAEFIAATVEVNGAPYGMPGDRLWVREAFHVGDFPGHYCYRADKTTEEGPGCTKGDAKWKPSIHMPRAACRLRLDVVSVRIERLHEITEEDALAEGTWIEHDCDTIHREEAYGVATFRCSWNTINAKRGYAWEQNPLVWRVQFRRVVA